MEIIENYFKDKSGSMEYKYSGWSLVDKINDMKPKSVLDIGCGQHHFKDKINNIFGIDPYTNESDLKIGIEELGTNKTYDVILALGSINFGNEEKINREMRCIDKLLNTDGHLFMRLNPGLKHNHSAHSDGIIFYHWTFDKIKHFALAYGYSILEMEEDPGFNRPDMRYYVHLIKL